MGWYRWGQRNFPISSFFFVFLHFVVSNFFFVFIRFFVFSLFFFAFSFFFVFLRFSSFFLRVFFVFLRSSLMLSKDKGKRLQFTAETVNSTPTPSAPTPCKTSRFGDLGHDMGGCKTYGERKNTPEIAPVKVAYRNPKTGLTRGVSQKKPAPEAYRAIGGIARNSIANRAIVGH